MTLLFIMKKISAILTLTQLTSTEKETLQKLIFIS